MPITAPVAAPTVHATIELGELLRQYQLGLVLIAGTADDAGERPVQWVHGSDLADPSPFLTPRTVLLTTGAQFPAPPTQAQADEYVDRLIAAGATALGVAAGVVWDRTPATLVAACDRRGFPLVRVPYDTPFIAIVQTAAQLLEAQARARDVWALDSQRAVSTAALQEDGLAAAIREAATRLGRGVALTDRSGRIIEAAPASARTRLSAEWIRSEARELVERGIRSGRSRDRDGVGVQLQTLGRAQRLMGVLLVEGSGVPDTAERTLIGLVAALATVQLEHRIGVDAAETALRGSVVRLLLAGRGELAAEISTGILPRLPRGQIAVILTDSFERSSVPAGTPIDDLRSIAAGRAGVLTAPRGGGAIVICEASELSPVLRIVREHGIAAGVSERGAMADLDRLIEQADQALERARVAGGGQTVEYRPSMQAGVLRLLDADPEARRAAEGLLAPVRQHDAKHGDSIAESLRVWLAHHGQTSPAAAALGVHRHTLRARVQTAESLLQRSLDDPDTRAELWAALRVIGEG